MHSGLEGPLGGERWAGISIDVRRPLVAIVLIATSVSSMVVSVPGAHASSSPALWALIDALAAPGFGGEQTSPFVALVVPVPGPPAQAPGGSSGGGCAMLDCSQEGLMPADAIAAPLEDLPVPEAPAESGVVVEADAAPESPPLAEPRSRVPAGN